MLKISKRQKQVIASPVRKFTPIIIQAEKRGLEVFKLNIGDPDIATPRIFFDTIKKTKLKTVGYSPSSGLKENVLAWQKHYQVLGVDLKAQEIIPTVGCGEAIMFALMSVADPGDEIIVFEPLYVSYKAFAAVLGIKLVPITLHLENNFSLPPKAEIIKKITGKTKAIVIINPDNPSGKAWQKKELEIIILIAKQKNLFVISDETYREIIFTTRPISLLNFKTANNFAIVIDSVSKKFSCPGARVGCLISKNTALMDLVSRLAMARLSVPTLEQYATVPLLSQSEKYIRPLVKEYQKRRDVVLQALSKIKNIKFSWPQGAFYMLIELPVKDAQDFVLFLLTKFQDKKQTVALTPARDFYLSKNGFNQVRLAFVLDQKKLKRAIEILDLGLKKYLKQK